MVFSLMWNVAPQWAPVELKSKWAELDVGRIRGLDLGANVRWLTDTLAMRGRMPRLRNSRWARSVPSRSYTIQFDAIDMD